MIDNVKKVLGFEKSTKKIAEMLYSVASFADYNKTLLTNASFCEKEIQENSNRWATMIRRLGIETKLRATAFELVSLDNYVSPRDSLLNEKWISRIRFDYKEESYTSNVEFRIEEVIFEEFKNYFQKNSKFKISYSKRENGLMEIIFTIVPDEN